MYPHTGGLRATITVLGLSVFFCSSAPGQYARFAARMPPRFFTANRPLVPTSCFDDLPAVSGVFDLPTTSASNLRPDCGRPPMVTTIIEPCGPPSLKPTACKTPQDPVTAALEGMGKAGRKILRARERVLEILESDNACSAWYQEKDSNPGATFRMIGFELDRKGADSVLEYRDVGPLKVFRNPYVARVIQGDGANATITINASGAFFSVMAKVLGVRTAGGPFDFRGQRTLRVGPYGGDTIEAQVLVLLHEFGHALDLLPTDENDVGGKSMRNTEEVLGHCRAQVDGKAKPKLLMAIH
jgi:hypothetical protein